MKYGFNRMIFLFLSRVLLFSVLWFSCEGCSPNHDAENETDLDDTEIQRLMSLGYVGASKLDDNPNKYGVIYVDRDKAYPGYSLYTIEWLGKSVLIDLNGRVVNSWERISPDEHWHNAELLSGGELLVVVAGKKLCLFGWDGTVIWEKKIASLHHDAEINSNGDIVFIRSNILKDRIAGLRVIDSVILRMTHDGKISGKLSLFHTIKKNGIGHKLLPREIKFWGKNATDLFHANSVECMRRPELAKRNPLYDLDNVLVSSRHQDCVLILNWEHKSLLWAWGHGELSGPHDATCLDNGNILVFDNGIKRGWSRVVEVNPMTNKIVWEYQGDKKLYTLGRGSAQRLPNGNTLIAISDAGRLLEVTSNGEIVWEFLNPEFFSKGKRWHFARVKRYKTEFIHEIFQQEK